MMEGIRESRIRSNAALYGESMFHSRAFVEDDEIDDSFVTIKPELDSEEDFIKELIAQVKETKTKRFCIDKNDWSWQLILKALFVIKLEIKSDGLACITATKVKLDLKNNE